MATATAIFFLVTAIPILYCAGLILWGAVYYRAYHTAQQSIIILFAGLGLAIFGLAAGGHSVGHFTGEQDFATGSLLVGIAGFCLFFASALFAKSQMHGSASEEPTAGAEALSDPAAQNQDSPEAAD